MNKGIWYAVGAYVTWGLFPVYWETLNHVPAVQLLGHRILWSFLLLFGIILGTRQWKAFRKAALTRRMVGIYSIAAVLIAVNWLTYVWAVGAGYILETSLGYFINPLLSVLLGVLLLKERLRPLQWIPLAMAAGAVVYLTVAYGALPWIALTLAVSFGFYGLVKKTAPLSPVQGLTTETGLLFLPALVYLLFCQFTGQAAFLHSNPTTNWMLFGAGLVTTAPLLLFAAASQRIPLTMMGVLQYVNPTLQFLLGTLVYHEPFTHDRVIGFSIVWLALILFAAEGFWSNRRKTSPAGAVPPAAGSEYVE